MSPSNIQPLRLVRRLIWPFNVGSAMREKLKLPSANSKDDEGSDARVPVLVQFPEGASYGSLVKSLHSAGDRWRWLS